MSPSRHILLLKPRGVYAVTKGVNRMVYDEPKKLDDFLSYGFITDADDRVSAINGKPIPFMFKTHFYIKAKSAKAFRSVFHVRVDEDGSPLLISIHTFGAWEFPVWFLDKLRNKEKLTKTEGERLVSHSSQRLPEGVQRYQSDFVAKYQTQLFDRAVLMGLNYSAKKSNISYTPKQLTELTKQIQATTRRKVTPALLKHVASIYLRAETSFPKANPIQEIMDELKVSHRRAQEYAQYARAQGYLPTPKQIKRKVKKQTKKKG